MDLKNKKNVESKVDNPGREEKKKKKRDGKTKKYNFLQDHQML